MVGIFKYITVLTDNIISEVRITLSEDKPCVGGDMLYYGGGFAGPGMCCISR